MRRLLIVIAFVASAWSGAATAASATWACVSVVRLDSAVCIDDPLPDPLPLPDQVPQPVGAELAPA